MNSSMCRIAIASLSLAVIACLAGCGGNDNSPQAFRGTTPFIGSWSGAWSTPGTTTTDSQGTVLLTVAKNSVITGSLTTDTRGTGILDGNITPGGEFYISVKFSGSTDNLHGFATLGSSSVLAGDGTRATNDQSLPFHLQLNML